MAQLKANGITLEYERDGAGDAPAILLICGLGMQLIYWSTPFVQRLLAGGFQVLRFDNRDTGLSQKIDASSVNTPYTIADMAADAVGLLDALGIDKAHIVGRSMGGIIAQPLVAEHPDRVLSLTIIMSTSNAPGLPDLDPEIEEMMLSAPDDPDDRDQVLDHMLAGDYAWGSPKYPFDELNKRRENSRAYDRCYYPDGVTHQFAAITASGSQVSFLQQIAAPALIIHGTHDTLLPLAHGRDIASRIAGAELMEIEGMGHSLDGDLSLIVADAIVAHARRIHDL